MPDRTIYVVNASTLVSDADVARMAAACSAQITRDVAPAHGLMPVPVVPITKDHIAPRMQVISVVDTLDQVDALGWHTEGRGERRTGVVGAKTVLDHGAKVLTGPYAVSTIFSHEVLEMFCDPTCTLWSDSGRGFMVSYEICDPVQAGIYDLGGISVSDFVTPDWFDPNNAVGDPVSFLKTIRKPFTIAKDGYYVQLQSGVTSEQFGEAVPGWVKEMKWHHHARAQRIQGVLVRAE